MAVVTYGEGLLSLSSSSAKPPREGLLKLRSSPLPAPNLLPLCHLPTSKSKTTISSLRISTRQGKPRIVASSNGRNLEEEESYASDSSTASSKEASFDLNLPRRNLRVQFTCNACGERTQRTINRVAYERGTVFVQCAGCLVNHKLVDNLGLVVEYDLRAELDADYDDTNQAKGE